MENLQVHTISTRPIGSGRTSEVFIQVRSVVVGDDKLALKIAQGASGALLGRANANVIKDVDAAIRESRKHPAPAPVLALEYKEAAPCTKVDSYQPSVEVVFAQEASAVDDRPTKKGCKPKGSYCSIQ